MVIASSDQQYGSTARFNCTTHRHDTSARHTGTQIGTVALQQRDAIARHQAPGAPPSGHLAQQTLLQSLIDRPLANENAQQRGIEIGARHRRNRTACMNEMDLLIITSTPPSPTRPPTQSPTHSPTHAPNHQRTQPHNRLTSGTANRRQRHPARTLPCFKFKVCWPIVKLAIFYD